MPTNPTNTRRFRRFSRALVILWAALVAYAVSTLMVAHAALPMPPSTSAKLRDGIDAMRPASARGWFAAHIVYSECRCSQRVFQHLLTRAPIRGVSETLVLVGPRAAMAASAERRGIPVVVLERDELRTRLDVVAAPLLVVADPRGAIRYSGGYTTRKQGPVIDDVRIIAELRAHRAPTELPLFGCATSRELAELLDPLGLRR